MKRMRFTLPYYNISVTLLQAEVTDDIDKTAALLRKNHIDKQYVDDITEGLIRGAVNGGETFRDFRYKMILVFFYPFEDDIRRAEIFSHEKRHIEDRVLEYFDVNDVESAGLLAGYLGVQFYKFERL